MENNETLIADLLSYAEAFRGRSGTAGYAIAAENAALAIRNLEAEIALLKNQRVRRARGIMGDCGCD